MTKSKGWQRLLISRSRESFLVDLRISKLHEQPLKGNFGIEHLQEIHGFLFRGFPAIQPGELRKDTEFRFKSRQLENTAASYCVIYPHDSILPRTEKVLTELGGVAGLSGLGPEAFASRMARLYGDLDHAHPFYEGNSRTLREFTRSLSLEAGYRLDWTPTSVGPSERNRLYIARDIAVLERTYPGLTPERGLQSGDKLEYEASRVLMVLQSTGHSLGNIIREQIVPLNNHDLASSLAHRQRDERPTEPKAAGPLSDSDRRGQQSARLLRQFAKDLAADRGREERDE